MLLLLLPLHPVLFLYVPFTTAVKRKERPQTFTILCLVGIKTEQWTKDRFEDYCVLAEDNLQREKLYQINEKWERAPWIIDG